MSEERRRFERVIIPASSGVYAASEDGKRLGEVRMLGRGGFQVQTKFDLKMGEQHPVRIIDESEGINREIIATVRNKIQDLTGYEFLDLGPDAAVEMGVIIGKY